LAASALTTGSDNITIAHPGTAGESLTTRLGSAQTRAFVAGIHGVTPAGASPLPVVIDSSGQLGTGGASLGTVTSIAAGPGLTGGTITSAGTLGLAATNLLPTIACATGQIPRWGGTAWACSADVSVPSGGTIDEVLVGPGSAPAWSGSPTLSSLALAGNLTLTQSSRVLMEGVNSFMHVAGGPTNTFIGADAGNFSLTGGGNTAVGSLAMQSNSSGNSNTAMGLAALRFNTFGAGNVAIGGNALNQNTAGGNNTAVGSEAMFGNTLGFANTAIGTAALRDNTTGGNNVAIGNIALRSNTTGADNVAIGREALFSNTAGFANTASGGYSLASNTTGASNTAIGFGALGANTTGEYNVAVGRGALGSNTTAGSNTAVGGVAL